jgi:isopenicillin N synthase-like dioxygenase
MSDVPVVDISADPEAVAAELDEICRTVGFFQMTGHGTPADVADRAWTMATRFFDLPMEDKLSVLRPGAAYPYGYSPRPGRVPGRFLNGVGWADPKEVFDAGPPVPPMNQKGGCSYPSNLWPAVLPEFQTAWMAYYHAMTDVGGRLMSLFARGLGLPPGFFNDKIDKGLNLLRAVNYPVQDSDSKPGQLRAAAHTDGGLVTILRQDTVGGLEVLDSGGNWIGVEPVSGAFVIILGDLMARWTNGWWRSSPHRVVDPPGPSSATARRQSIPFSQNANWSARDFCLTDAASVPVMTRNHLQRHDQRVDHDPAPRYLPGAQHNALRKPGLHPDCQVPGFGRICYSGLASHSGRIASMLSS